MDDALKQLEGRLERLAPRGLSDHAVTRLETQIDELAEEAGPNSPRWVRWVTAGAAMLGLLATLMVLAQPRGPEEAAAAAAEQAGAPWRRGPSFETLELVQNVEDRFDGGNVLGDGTEAPHRYWGYEVTETEDMVDCESGLRVRISSKWEEAVLTKITTY